MEIEYINFYKENLNYEFMINIENITKREEEKKLHFKRTKKLLDEFFDNIFVLRGPNSISVTEEGKFSSLLYIDVPSSKIILSVSEEKNIPKYTDKTLAFAKEYEKKFNVKVTLQTDYSK